MNLDPVQVEADVLDLLSNAAPSVHAAPVRENLLVAGLRLLIDEGRLSPSEVEDLVLLGRTLWPSAIAGRLTDRESLRLGRVVGTILAAERTFGSVEKAARWLRRPTKALEDRAPLAMLETDEGAERVDELLNRIDHGLAV